MDSNDISFNKRPIIAHKQLTMKSFIHTII